MAATNENTELQEQERLLREVHRKITMPEFRSLSDYGQKELVNKANNLLERESVPMSDKRRLINLLSVLDKEDSVKEKVSEIMTNWGASVSPPTTDEKKVGLFTVRSKLALVGFTSVAVTTSVVIEMIPNCDVIQATFLSIAIWLLGAGFGMAVGYELKGR